MAWEIHSFASNRELVEDLAGQISLKLQAAIACQDRASLAVSGGSTPAALFDRLCSADIEWDKVCITLVDERWVPEQSADSNARLVRSRLIRARASYADFIGLKTEQPDPFVAVKQVNERLQQISWPLDVVVLGMGEDGHTASFFAGARGVELAMDPVGELSCAAVESEAAPHPRMTLTLPALVSSNNLFLHIVGNSKRLVLDRAIAESVDGKLPIGRILHRADTLVHIYFTENP